MRFLTLAAINLFSMPLFAQVPQIEPGVPQELARWRAAHYSDVRYKLNLTLEKMAPLMRGEIEIRVMLDEVGAANDLILDWRTTQFQSDKDRPIVDVWAINQVKSDVPGSIQRVVNEHLLVPTQYLKNGENVVRINFTTPIKTSGSAITRYIDKEDGSEYIYSLFVPSDASTAFPVFDQPDLKARFQLTTKIPYEWRIVSNTDAPMRSAMDPGAPINCVFDETKPISTYVFAFAAGPWQEFSAPGKTGGNPSGSEGVINSAHKNTLPTGRVSASADQRLSSHIYVRKSQAAKFQPHAAEVFRLNREGVKFLEEYFGYKFPWPKYDLVLIPEFPFGGMEHAGATFLSERGVIFPSEPTANDYISRANLIFHETAHQWFGDTVTMRWFDDLWLKEGFAEFMAYKTLEKTMPQYNAWKAFYERNKPAAYFTDSTRGTTPIYQSIDNLSAAKSAYGNIVYRKAPSFLRQAEFYLGPDKFQTAVRAFLKKHAFANATWQDLVSEFEAAGGQDLKAWADAWVRHPGVPFVKVRTVATKFGESCWGQQFERYSGRRWDMKVRPYLRLKDGSERFSETDFRPLGIPGYDCIRTREKFGQDAAFFFPNYGDYGYGIFLLDDKSREYVLKNIQNERDDFLRSMMWGALWDSVREAELDPRQYVELVIKNLPAEKDETITASVLGRVSTAMTYYLADKPRDEISPRLESMLIDRLRTAPTLGQRITYYRAFLNIVSTENGRRVLKDMLKNTGGNTSVSECVGSKPCKNTLPNGRVSASVAEIPLKTKDRFDIVTRLAILNDPDAPKLLADLEKTETSDDAKRYDYAARAAFPTKETKQKFWDDFVSNKEISESWIEAAFGPFNSPRHADLTLPYLERALAELPNLKRSRKIFFVNGWLGAFIGGQKSQQALDIVNKFLADNPNLDRDLRLKILENVDIIERAVKIRAKYGKS